MTANKMTCLMIGALPSSLVNFRGPLIKDIIAGKGMVSVAANGRDDRTERELSGWGVRYYPIRIARAGINPLADIATVLDLVKVIRQVRPDIVLSYTIKPIIYGGLAARLCGVRNVYSMVEGLGRAFMPWESFLHAISSVIARGLYRAGLRFSNRVFFLNPDDLQQFVNAKYVPLSKTVLLNGIGIDLDYYAVANIKIQTPIRFLMIARLLKDKGVREYVKAARIVISRKAPAEFILAGDLDENPSSITREELKTWQDNGWIKYLGFIEDVRPSIADSSVFVLPSYYREGTPRTVLEAMAMGRPIITTDAPGCRETVVDGDNGFLIPIKDVDALVKAMERFIANPQLVASMGKRSREIAQEKYDVHKVNEVILKAMGLNN